MRKLSFGVMLIALSTLVLELMLTRVFDVILIPNLAYFVVTAAVFSFGLAGIYATIVPIPVEGDISQLLATKSIFCALSTALLIPLINLLNLDYTHLGSHPFTIGGSYVVLYLALVVPFFLAGSVLIAVFSKYAFNIQNLYFWDLCGAGLGSIIVVPLISTVGPGGLMLVAASLALLAAALFTNVRTVRFATVAIAIAAVLFPLIKAPDYIDFVAHLDKRGVKQALEEGRGEFARWDPISKVDVIDETWTPKISVPWHLSGDRKAIQYDAGNQSSFFYKFDGNLPALRDTIAHDKTHVDEQFWHLGVLASHYLKRDSAQNVLIIGSAGGQETKAALMYGARHVDAVELVPTVVELGKGRYSSYIGNIFRNPAVHVEPGEGRSFLRHSASQYDIIQIFSNHTNSSIAQGTGALAPVYLQTAEAYQEYFSHLAPNGVLHINNFLYPRMITTAALAWTRMGRDDFARHVVVFSMPSQPSLPTLMIKMSPWTAAEIADLQAFLYPREVTPDHRLTMVEDPLDPSKSFLSADFYSGHFPDALAARMPVQVTARTDNMPFFSNARKSLAILHPDPANFLDAGTANVLNQQLIYSKGIPMDWVHLILTGIASIIYIAVFVFVPLWLSAAARENSVPTVPLLTYFSCLGGGFITIELVFIQKFTHLIGSPLYTYSTVLFTMLVSAGIGSAASKKMGISQHRRWGIPFAGILILGTALMLLYPSMAHYALSLPLLGRMAASALMMFPLGFFLGMPFPLGILSIADQPRATVAWAWGMNGLFTVVGGYLSVLISMWGGFNLAIGCALGLYALAIGAFALMKNAATHAIERGTDGATSAIS